MIVKIDNDNHALSYIRTTPLSAVAGQEFAS
jgi:hypothetical protein